MCSQSYPCHKTVNFPQFFSSPNSMQFLVFNFKTQYILSRTVTARTAVCLHCSPRHLSPPSRPYRCAIAICRSLNHSLTVRVISLAQFTYFCCTLHELYPHFSALWSLVPFRVQSTAYLHHTLYCYILFSLSVFPNISIAVGFHSLPLFT